MTVVWKPHLHPIRVKSVGWGRMPRAQSWAAVSILLTSQVVVSSVVVLAGCTIVPLEQPRRAEAPEQPATPPLPPPPSLGQTVDKPPEIMSMTGPEYPESAREGGVQGTVFCDVLVDTLGTIREVRVARGVSPELDEAAVTAVRTAVFKPAQRNGALVECWKRVPVEFSLHN